MSNNLGTKLLKVFRELKSLERHEPINYQVRLESLQEQMDNLQRRYRKQNGFDWHPLMYEGRRGNGL